MTSFGLSEGAVFAGDYRIVRPLAQGGMGAVYVVEQISTGRQRALKVMHQLLVADAVQRERFVQEAKVGGLVDSDHVVEVIGAGVDEASKMPWLCMELLEGETLRDRLERLGSLPRAEIVEIATQLRHALARAHERGLVHRDLKPENIFLERPRRTGVPFTVKVLDFGIAKLVQQAQGKTGSGTQSMGSPLWMAPEQANAEPVSPATDVWALGLIAFAALTGKHFWKTASKNAEEVHITQLLVEILVEPLASASERARELGAQVPDAAFDRWFAGCVSRAPRERYPEAGAALDALLGAFGGAGALDATLASSSAPSLSSIASASSSSESASSTAGVTSEKIGRPARGTSIGLIAAAIALAVLGMFAFVGSFIGVWLWSDDEPMAQTPASNRSPPPVPIVVGPPLQPLGPAPVSPTPIPPASVDPAPPPIDAPPTDDPPTDDPREAAPRRRPIATTAFGRRFYGAVVSSCWQEELARQTHPSPTRMRIELILGAGGRVTNVALPPAWRGTPFAACVVMTLGRSGLSEPADDTSVVLSLPASG